MKKILLVTIDFPPLTGGVANYYLNRVNKISLEQVVVLMNRIPHYSLPVTHYQFKIYYKNFFIKLIWPHWLLLIWHSYKIAKCEKIEMFWVGQVLPVGTAVYLVNKILKIPYFVTCHGNDLLRAKSVARKYKLAKKILQNAEYLEANTEFTKSILIKDFEISKDKIKIVYPECILKKEMVDKNKVEELKRKYNLENKKVLLTVARLVKSKGVDQIIRALEKVWAEIPNLVYLIVGDGQEKGNLEKIAGDKVVFVDNVPFKELANYYALADAFILTPRKFSPLTKGRIKEGLIDTESFGIVYLEAKEFGLPVIAGDVGGVREINYDKITLVDSENIDEISQKIKNQISKSKNTYKR